eukprot:356281_1
MTTIITKVSLLTFMSILSGFISGSVMSVLPLFLGKKSSDVRFGIALAALIDVYCNFLSIVYGFGIFDGHYMKVCGCCDRRLKAVCYPLTITKPPLDLTAVHSSSHKSEPTKSDLP